MNIGNERLKVFVECLNETALTLEYLLRHQPKAFLDSEDTTRNLRNLQKMRDAANTIAAFIKEGDPEN